MSGELEDRYVASQEEMREMAELCVKMLHSLIEAGTDSIMPQLAVRSIGEGGLGMFIFALATGFNEHEEKHAAMRFCGKQAYEMKIIPTAVCMHSEAWFSSQRPGSPYTQPRHDPARQEVLIVQTLNLRRETGPSCMIHISRDKDNQIIVGETKWMEEYKRMEANLLESFYLGFFHESLKKHSERN